MSRGSIRRYLALGALAAALLAAPVAANAATPVVPETFVSEVTETSALLHGAVAPSKSNAEAHFEYVSDAAYKTSGFATATKTDDVKVPLSVTGNGDLVGPVSATGDLTENSPVIRNLSVPPATFTIGQNVSGENIPIGAKVRSLGSDTLTLSIPIEAGKSKTGVAINGLASNKVTSLILPASGTFVPGQTISAKNGKGIKAETSIVAVDGDLLTLSQPATETIDGADLTAMTTIAQGSGTTEEGTSSVLHVATSAGTFLPGQALTGSGIRPGTTITQVSDDEEPGRLELSISRRTSSDGDGVALTASSPQPIAASISALSPQTPYHLRLVATDSKGNEETGPEVVFFTLAEAPIFEPCPNDVFRNGELSPFGSPAARLPDCRSYEQASPVNKDGGDVQSDSPYAKAADDGNAVVFGSTFGMPGAEGAQETPFFLGTRGAGENGWSTRGLLAPAPLAQKGRALRGWLPDFSATFASALRLTDPLSEALYELHPDGSPPTLVAPFAPLKGGEDTYNFAGASADGSVVLFESRVDLQNSPLTLLKGVGHDLYAWDANTGVVSAGRMNTEVETETLLSKGTHAGPYHWLIGQLGIGGAERGFYLSGMHAIADDGSVFFTSASDGQLYQRLNPTAPQSEPGPEGYVENGHCAEPEKACTVHVSETRKQNGGPKNDGPDPAGPQPAAFMAASADGKIAYFTSSEKLTDDANTGPEQPAAQIGTADPSDPAATKNESFIPTTHALGLAADTKDEYIYWADPSKGTIGRAKLTPDGSAIEGLPDPSFIEPGETEAITSPTAEPGVYHSAPSRPRYVTVGACAEGGECVYWTNTGPPSEEDTKSGPIDGGGTIGRATVQAGAVTSVSPEFIKGASNPRGLAINSGYLYWANAGSFLNTRAIGRALIDGSGLDQEFFSTGTTAPYGVAVSSTGIYYSTRVEEEGRTAGIESRDLDGSEESTKFLFIGGDRAIRGLAIDSEHVYWSSQSDEAIGRADLALTSASMKEVFLPLQGAPGGLALSGNHLYWSVNGESPGNPGNDLYRYGLGGKELEDLTPDSSANGAEVLGVLGTSDDGSYVYFVANGILDDQGPAVRGDCKGYYGGHKCSLYLWHQGATSYVAPFKAVDDSPNIALAPRELAGTATYIEKTSFVSPDGRTLLFRSVEPLTGYDNQGFPEYFLYHAGDGTLRCVTCNPSGSAPSASPELSSVRYGGLGPVAGGVSAVASRHLSADGSRFFFETSEALVSSDVNGRDGCPLAGVGEQQFRSCNDVYEWEAPGSGTCVEHGFAYSELNQGCIYLISTGRSAFPSLFIDASESGGDVFFMTRDSLVGQDTDQITDIYDARVNGGLTSQNARPAPPCEIEGCLPDATPPPQVPAPPNISGPPDPKPKRCKGKKKCNKKHGHKKHHKRKRDKQHHQKHKAF
jgi:hypothetical protein